MASSSLIFFACVILISTAQNVTHRKLPTAVRPTSYVVTMNIDMVNFNFTGSVSITLRVTEPTNTITIHIKDLELTGIRLEGGDGTQITHLGSTTSNEADYVVWILSSNLAVGQEYVLIANYTGVLASENVGLYRTSYLDESNKIRNLAVTQFAPTYARRVFPCFDQPDMKATFRIILIRDPKYITTSNMHMESSQAYPLDSTKIVDTYAITPIMSTYLVAFTVSEHANLSINKNTIYGRKVLLDKGEGDYALTVAGAAINAMVAYTSVSYDLLKIDQFAIPDGDYEFSAMENWGMVTYRERNLMYNQMNSTAAEKQNIATAIAHELAHQWFGNLVTPRWWTWVWLKDGFATYFKMIITDQLEPDWKLMDQFITSVMQAAFSVDALLSTTPMTKKAETSSDIIALYDTIAYEKAGSVIKMIASFLGEQTFKEGLTAYLRDWGFKNVEPADLYSSWQTALNNNAVNVSQIMASWETQSGFPVVTVTRNYSDDTINLSQTRFLLNTNVTDETTKWFIPINWFSPTVPVNEYRIFTEDIDVNSSVPTEDWLIANFNREGYYRVNYDEDNWKLIVDALVQNLTQIPVRNRAQLVDDSFNLARACLLDYSVAFDLGKYIADEEEYVPIAAFTNALSYLHRITTGTVYNTYIKNYGLEILAKIYNRNGFVISPEATHLQKLLKVNLMPWLCDFGHEECLAKSLEAFRASINDSVGVQPDAQSFVYCNALKGSASFFADVLTISLSANNENQRSRAATALGCINVDMTLKGLLDVTISSEMIFKATDRLGLLVSIYSNNQEKGVALFLDVLTSRYTEVASSFGSSMTRIVNDLADRITNTELLLKFNDFAEVNDQYFTDSFKVTVARAILTAEYNLEWLEIVSPQFESYFATPATTNTENPTTSLTTNTTTSSITPEITPPTIPATTAEIAPETTSEITSETTAETTPETTPGGDGSVSITSQVFGVAICIIALFLY